MSDKQIKARTLCAACEDLLNKNGESWVLKHCFRGDDNFKLKSLLQPQYQNALWGNNNIKAFCAAKIPEIDIEKLAYFAASIIWRAAVHQWGIERMLMPNLKIDTTYMEELRLYLLGEAGFPTDAVVLVSVVPSSILSTAFTPVYCESIRGWEGNAFARVERCVANAIRVCEQSFDANQHPALR